MAVTLTPLFLAIMTSVFCYSETNVVRVACNVAQTGCNYVITMQQYDECDHRVSTGNRSILSSDNTRNDNIILSRLIIMQDKLARMIKDLSVRTLRHIRQIKANLHKVCKDNN